MKKFVLILSAVILIITAAACGSQNEDAASNGENGTPVFKIGGIPDQNVSDLNRRFGELADYISAETGLEVEYVPSVDYAALVKAFERGEVHLAWFGGLTGVQARNAVPEAEAIAQRPRDEQFHSVFIARKDLPIETLEDLKGVSFTFGSESSTSGHLMPRYFLMEAGIDPEKDFDGVPNYSGSHDKTYKLVESGAFQAGALNEAVWESAVEEGKVDLDKVKVFYTTPAYFDYNWTINDVDRVFGEGTKAKVKEALLSMKNKQQDILDLFQTDRFIETKNENYQAIEQIARELGIIK
ncbi:MAG: putative selenate ABC transporter substrate-binding protein [Bacillaceae bacterium]|nr:putative selenate ABC transporter substrate-binding protein [Bacillaceae bacterium]